MLTVSQLLALPCLPPQFSPHIADRPCSGFSERFLAAVGATPMGSRGVCLAFERDKSRRIPCTMAHKVSGRALGVQ